MKGYIYKIINKINGKFYIGSTVNFEKRKRKHLNELNNNKHHNIFLQRAFKKYGIDSFDFSYKEKEFNNIKELHLLEERYINYCWSSGKLYNVSKKSSGGDLISYHPNNKQFRELQSKLLKERYSNMSAEEKKKMSENLKGDKNPNFGNRWSDEQRLKASERMKREKKSLFYDYKGKTFEEIFGEEKTKMIKERISKSSSKRIGEKNSFYGKHHSDETKKILSEKRKGVKPINCKKVMFNDIIYESAMECSKKLNINYLTVCYRAKNNIYGFSYVDKNSDKEQHYAKIMWDSEKCENVAKTCKTKKEFREKNVSAYGFAKKHGLLKEFSEKYFNELRHYWSLDEFLKIASKYTTYKEFRENERKAY